MWNDSKFGSLNINRMVIKMSLIDKFKEKYNSSEQITYDCYSFREHFGLFLMIFSYVLFFGAAYVVMISDHVIAIVPLLLSAVSFFTGIYILNKSSIRID